MTDGIMMDTLQQARDFFQNDRFATENGMTIRDASQRHALIGLVLTGTHRNAAGSVMGGVLFTMADFACAVAANFGSGTGLHVSADANVRFLRPCSGGTLAAEAICVKHGDKLSFYDVSISDETGAEIAAASFTMCRVK